MNDFVWEYEKLVIIDIFLELREKIGEVPVLGIF